VLTVQTLLQQEYLAGLVFMKREEGFFAYVGYFVLEPAFLPDHPGPRARFETTTIKVE